MYYSRYIMSYEIYLICVFEGYLIEKVWQMTSKLSGRGKEAGYLLGYLVLLLFSVSGLIVQGGMWLLVGFVCWFGVVFSVFGVYYYRHHSKA